MRDDLKRRYDAAAAGARVVQASDAAMSAQLWADAADAFVGTKQADEVTLRLDALAESALRWRHAHRWDEAVAAYTLWGNEAARDVGPKDKRSAYAPYYTGLTRNSKGDVDGAIASFTTALARFRELGTQEEVRAVAAALGLAQLQQMQFQAAVDTLRRVAGGPNADDTQASILHNLCFAARKAGLRELAVPFGAQAAALRQKLQGANHPLTVETELVWAQALISAGQLDEAGPIIKRSAATILAGAGEAHAFFADALLAEALRQARLGDGTAGEALARRAMFICSSLNQPAVNMKMRQEDQASIPALWRPNDEAKDGRDVKLWVAKIKHTLRRYQPNELNFAGSGDRDRTWLLFVPRAAREQDAKTWVQVAFASINLFLNAREPADAGFLDATSVEVHPPSKEELLSFDYGALYKQIVWEPSIAFAVGRRLAWPLDPEPLGQALAAHLTLLGAKGDLEKPLHLFGLKPEELNPAIADPEKMLREVVLAPLSR